MSPLRYREIKLSLWQVNQHTSDLWSFLLTHNLLHVLVDHIADNLLLLASVSSLELLRDKHLLNLLVILLGIVEVNKLWCSRGGNR